MLAAALFLPYRLREPGYAFSMFVVLLCLVLNPPRNHSERLSLLRVFFHPT
jgi:hypothetical protein